MFTLFSDKILAGKSIKYGKGVKYTQDLTNSGKDSTGANKPDKNKVGININFSKELAFSVQKQKQAIMDWIKNWIKKEKKVEINDIKIVPIEGDHKLSGLKIKKKIAIINANGNLVICSAICCAKYLKKGCIGWIK